MTRPKQGDDTPRDAKKKNKPVAPRVIKAKPRRGRYLRRDMRAEDLTGE